MFAQPGSAEIEEAGDCPTYRVTDSSWDLNYFLTTLCDTLRQGTRQNVVYLFAAPHQFIIGIFQMIASSTFVSFRQC